MINVFPCIFAIHMHNKIFAKIQKSGSTLNPFPLFTFTFMQLVCGFVNLFVAFAFTVLRKIFVGITRKSAKAQVNPEDQKNQYLDIFVYPAAPRILDSNIKQLRICAKIYVKVNMWIKLNLLAPRQSLFKISKRRRRIVKRHKMQLLLTLFTFLTR